MRSLIYRAFSLFIVPAVIVIYTIITGPNPFAKLEDFTSVTGRITEKRIMDYSSNDSGDFHLKIYVWSKGVYDLSEKSRERIDHYFAAVPTNGPITIHFRDELDRHCIYDARDGDRIFIPFNDIMAEVRREQMWSFGFAGLLSLFGWFLWRRISNRQKNLTAQNEHPDHQYTPR